MECSAGHENDDSNGSEQRGGAELGQQWRRRFKAADRAAERGKTSGAHHVAQDRPLGGLVAAELAGIERRVMAAPKRGTGRCQRSRPPRLQLVVEEDVTVDDAPPKQVLRARERRSSGDGSDGRGWKRRGRARGEGGEWPGASSGSRGGSALSPRHLLRRRGGQRPEPARSGHGRADTRGGEQVDDGWLGWACSCSSRPASAQGAFLFFSFHFSVLFFSHCF